MLIFQGLRWLLETHFDPNSHLHPGKTNMSPKKWTISIGNTSSNHHFSGDMLVFRGVMEVWCIFSRRWLDKPFICHGTIPNEEKTRGTTCAYQQTPVKRLQLPHLSLQQTGLKFCVGVQVYIPTLFYCRTHSVSSLPTCWLCHRANLLNDFHRWFQMSKWFPVKKKGKPTISNSKTTTLTKQLHMFKVNHRHHSWKTSSHFLFQTLIFGSFPWFKQLQHIWKSQNTPASAPT